MRNIILFDSDTRDQLLPLVFTRPVCELRTGILTIREKWEQWLKGEASFITQDYLSDKFPIRIASDNFVINGSVLPNSSLCRLIEQLEFNEALLKDGELIAARLDERQFDNLMGDNDIEELIGFELEDTPMLRISNLWDLFVLNDVAIRSDFELLTEGRVSQPLSASNQVIAPEHIFVEEGAVVECSILNASSGPIYIGKNAEIMEGCTIRGALALCESASLKMGSKIYGATTIGPGSKAGGEIKNAILMANSNKSHEGFLGNSVLGEWCNIGADTNTSNLKNNYEEVRLWDYTKNGFGHSGLQFLGLIMGDHSKCGINTMFNTGTVVGVSANIFGAGYPRNFIPSFSWGGPGGYSTFQYNKACEVAERVMARRNVPFTDEDRAILRYIFDFSAQFRSWEKS